MKKGFIGSIVTAVIIVIGLIVLFSCAEKVPAGYVGIVYNMNGGVADEFLTQGWHFVSPTKDVTLYSIGIEQSYLTATENGDSKDDDSFEVPSSDGKGLDVDLTFTYRYDVDSVTEIFKRFRGQSGKEVRDSFIKPNIISWVKEVTARYPVSDILGEERANLNGEITEYVHNKFMPYGIIIDNVSLIDIRADKNTIDSVQRKVEAQQDLEVAKIQKETANVNANKDKEVAIIEANREKEVASIKAEKEIIKAKGEADAKTIEAEAEAKANKMIAESLTQELIDLEKYRKWNGDVPKIVGQSANPIINMDDLN